METELEIVLESGTKYQSIKSSLGDDGVWSEQETAVNAFSLVHHDFSASINNLQYTMVQWAEIVFRLCGGWQIDCVENLLEMGYAYVKNILPNQLYSEVLSPTELRDCYVS